MVAVHNSQRLCRLHVVAREMAMSLFALSFALCIPWGTLAAQMQHNGSNLQSNTPAVRHATLDSSPNATVLDRVVAVVDGTAILASDVDEEMRFAALQPEKEPSKDNTPQRALQRLVDRTLIDQQRILQPGLADISQQHVDREIADLKKRIPACAEYKCTTEAGWQAFLQAHDFTQQEVENRVRERLAVLKFIDMRFGVAIRVPNADVHKYYDQTLKPELLHNHATVPEFNTVAPQIREILRQQQVSAMVDQWLKSLQNEGHVQILDPAYGQVGSGL